MAIPNKIRPGRTGSGLFAQKRKASGKKPSLLFCFVSSGTVGESAFIEVTQRCGAGHTVVIEAEAALESLYGIFGARPYLPSTVPV